jgi:hypothetical protein
VTPIRVVCDGELIPGATKFGFLVNPNNPNAESDTSNARRTADTLDRKIVVLEARTASTFGSGRHWAQRALRAASKALLKARTIRRCTLS